MSTNRGMDAPGMTAVIQWNRARTPRDNVQMEHKEPQIKDPVL